MKLAKLKVAELIEKLKEYNPEAETDVIAMNYSQDFSLSCGGSDGCTKENCDSVSFYVDALNQSEDAG